MISVLVKTINKQTKIIRTLSAIIDELFVLLSHYVTMEEIEPLLTSIKDVSTDIERQNA